MKQKIGYGELKAALLAYIGKHLSETVTAREVWEGIGCICGRTLINTALIRLNKEELVEYKTVKAKDPKTGYVMLFYTFEKLKEEKEKEPPETKGELTSQQRWQNLWRAIRKGETSKVYSGTHKSKAEVEKARRRKEYGWYSREENTFKS